MKKNFLKMRWLFTMLLFVTSMIMPSMMWAGSITPAKPNGEGTAEKPYQIGNAAELYWFAGLVNGTLEGVEQNKSAHAKLTTDITVNEGVLDENKELVSGVNFTEWTPIGSGWVNYTGTFDGYGHSVSGLYFNNPSSDNVGLFGYIGENGKILNVGVLDSYFMFEMAGGGVCGMNYGELQNCSNSSTVIGNKSGNYFDMGTGGVCGVNYGTITNCFNAGTVSGKVRVGGVCGENISTITNCFNAGTVSGSGIVGGVCGKNKSTITNCFNAGSTVSGSGIVGGVCGENKSTITNCYYLMGTATGGITGKDVSGSAEPMSLKPFNSGEVAWLLNGSTSVPAEGSTLAWYQKLGEKGDEYPVLTPKDGNTVYNKYYICVDKQVYMNVFSNTDTHEKFDKHNKGTETLLADGLYSSTCQRCQTDFKYIKDFCGISGNDLELTDDNGKYIANAVTLKDGEAYNSPVDIEVKDLKYARTYAANKWQPLYVPFAMSVDQWTGKGLTVASINNFHETKLKSGETQVLLEVKKVTCGSLEPNVPYLISCDAEGEKQLELGTTTLFKEKDGTIDCHSVTRNYVFQGKYTTKNGFGASETAIYYGVKDGEMVQLTAEDEIGPQNWYLTVTNRPNAYDVDTPLTSAAKAISIRVIGDGEATGIEDIHVVSDEGENGKQGIFDLQGRKLDAEPTHGIYIKNGEKYVK